MVLERPAAGAGEQLVSEVLRGWGGGGGGGVATGVTLWDIKGEQE